MRNLIRRLTPSSPVMSRIKLKFENICLWPKKSGFHFQNFSTKMSTWNCGSPRMCPGLIKFKKQEEKLKWQNIFMNMTMLVWKAEECVSAWFNKCHRFRVQTKIQISHRLFYFYLATTKILTTLYPINAWFRNIF